MDQSRIDVSSNSSDQQCQQNLSELKKQVQLQPSQLRQITNTNQFVQRVVQLNNNAKQSIDVSRPKEALVYLAEAERILQHAASYGKTIDRNLIIHILHNSGCCHQKTWQLTKCSDYLEALIFNYNSYIKNQDGQYSQITQFSQGRKSKQTITLQKIQRKFNLAKYYLQFQVVNSQNQNHSGALVAGRKAIQILKTIFRQIGTVYKSLKKSAYQKKFDVELKTKIIDSIVRLQDHIPISQCDLLFSATVYYLNSWNANVSSKQKDRERNFVLQEEFKNYSIGNPLSLTPMTYQKLQIREKMFTCKTILQKLLILVIGFFTIATQLRYVAGQKHKNDEPAKKNSSQFKQSQIYHLLSILLTSIHVPFDILLMKHLVNSYDNHYKINLFEYGKNKKYVQVDPATFEAFLFPFNQKMSEATSIVVSGINQNPSPFDAGKIQIINTPNRSAKQMQSPNQTQSKDLQKSKKKRNSRQVKNSNYDSKDEGYSKDSENTISTGNKTSAQSNKNIKTQQQSNKKIKISNRNKSKSKSKNKIIVNSLHMKNEQFKTPLDRSPVPKSPMTHHMKDSRGLIKIKTTHRLKISTEKIQYRKDDKKEKKSPSINFDYFMGKSKDLAKLKKMKKESNIPASPKIHNTSKSSSKRESPIANYFQPMKIGRKTVKSPNQQKQRTNKSKKKNLNLNFQQYYL